jgi:2-polyprenyl-3-methyl-5-hydroxy-6-metoxy-1,4-benzoquinol methylase
MLVAKRVLFPGLNLHARDRLRRIPQKFGPEIGPGTHVLDAGCGNGMLSHEAWKRGAKVLGISIKQKEVDGCRAMFSQGQGMAGGTLRFENVNLYSLSPQLARFDAIICTEVLEHIRDDRSVCKKFFELLKPGGRLHVTSPNAEHPYNRDFPLDPDERGGHVRPGYTAQRFRALLEPIGFAVEEVSGLGGPVRQAFNRRIKATQERFGAAAGLPLFIAALPFLWLDPPEPAVPFSLYVRARKRIAQ